MPIYEYQCESCGHTLEALQKISDDPLKDCPACQTAALKKLISAAAFHLKGSGWYETDFKSKSGNKAGGSENAASTTAKSPGEGKSTGASGCGAAGGCHSGSKS